MQLNSLSNGKLRILSGVLIGIICISVSFASPSMLLAFLACILILVSYEFCLFYDKKLLVHRLLIFFLSLTGGVLGYFNFIAPLLTYITLLFCLFSIILLYLTQQKRTDWNVVISALFYPGLCLGILAHYLTTQSYSYPILLLFFTLIWSSDTGAYYFGKQFGKRKLLEKVSPKKTLEGLLGGGVTTVLCSVIWFFIYPEYHISLALILGIVTWLSCSYGDLVQSQLKRNFELKDSSNLIPGHGGFFDRFDGFIFAAPFFVITHYLVS